MKNTLPFLVILIVVLAGITGYLGYSYYITSKSLSKPPSTFFGSGQESKIIEIEGTVSCLPVKPGDDYEDDGCTFGLKTDDGKYYVLIGDNKLLTVKTLVLGNRLRVAGFIDPSKKYEHFVDAPFVVVTDVKLI